MTQWGVLPGLAISLVILLLAATNTYLGTIKIPVPTKKMRPSDLERWLPNDLTTWPLEFVVLELESLFGPPLVRHNASDDTWFRRTQY
jgi:hypothetical protein